MAKLTFLWHLHQPLYRTANRRAHAPWVLLHAAGEYLTLVHVLSKGEWRGHVINLTATLLDQLAAYRDGVVNDPLLEILRTPAAELEPKQQRELVLWATLSSPPQKRRWPRLAELVTLASGVSAEDLPRRLSQQDLTDLQVLTILAYAAANAPWEDEIRDLVIWERGFSDASRRQGVAWLADCPGKLLTAYKLLAQKEGIEISTSPFGHPLLPLVIDTGIVTESWAPHPAPPVPAFVSHHDAREHIKRGIETAQCFGFAPRGCWPPEGGVSEATLELLAANDILWTATDEGILAASLARTLSSETGVDTGLFASWQLADIPTVMFFRHRGLSDFISFQACRYDDETQAASDLADQIRKLSKHLDRDSGIVLALDGENPWTSFPSGGARFLPALAHELAQSQHITPATLTDRALCETPRRLDRLHPGSWIGSTFASWIGHEEKNRGWELLASLQPQLEGKGGVSWLAAQGSDWWWWLGDDNPTALAPLYDQIFRDHLMDACRTAGITPPAELAASVRRLTTRLVVPLSRTWPAPILDGRTTSYYEWLVAAWVEAPGDYRILARAGLRADEEYLWLRLDTRPDAGAPVPVIVTVEINEQRSCYALPSDLPHDCVVAICLEARLPRPSHSALVALECRGERLPTNGFWQIELVEVDEP